MYTSESLLRSLKNPCESHKWIPTHECLSDWIILSHFRTFSVKELWISNHYCIVLTCKRTSNRSLRCMFPSVYFVIMNQKVFSVNVATLAFVYSLWCTLLKWTDYILLSKLFFTYYLPEGITHTTLFLM